jgi:hypothetical protein
MCIEGDTSVCGSGSGWRLDWQWQGGSAAVWQWMTVAVWQVEKWRRLEEY